MKKYQPCTPKHTWSAKPMPVDSRTVQSHTQSLTDRPVFQSFWMKMCRVIFVSSKKKKLWNDATIQSKSHCSNIIHQRIASKTQDQPLCLSSNWNPKVLLCQPLQPSSSCTFRQKETDSCCCSTMLLMTCYTPSPLLKYNRIHAKWLQKAKNKPPTAG